MSSSSGAQDLMPVETDMDVRAIKCESERLIIIPTAALAMTSQISAEAEEEEEEEEEEEDEEEATDEDSENHTGDSD